jgi:hypothetical protein
MTIATVCRAGDLHVHYFGADAFSFGGIRLQARDVMRVEFHGFGRALCNPVAVDRTAPRLVSAPPL